MVPGASIGRIVIYRSRTGDYDVPAIINCTEETIAEKGVQLWRDSDEKKGVPALTPNRGCVHLTVFTPGLPGQRGNAEDFKVESAHGISENMAGCYQEWDIPFCGEDEEITPGTWRWPTRV